MKSRFLHSVSAAAIALALAAPAFAPAAFAQTTPAPAAPANPGTGARMGGNPAAATAPAQMTGVGPVTGGTAPAPGSAGGQMAGRIDQRITQLHKRLRITQAQESQWTAFAGIMRSNAQQMDQLWSQQMGNVQGMTAPQSMQAYSTLAQAHAQQVQQLVPAFQSLYDSFSPQQKQIADRAFSPRQGRPNQAGRRGGRGNGGGANQETPSNG